MGFVARGLNQLAARRARLEGEERARPYELPAEWRGAVAPELLKSWPRDREFIEEMRRFDPTERSMDRKFFLRELLKLVDHLEGDTAEAGVFQGSASWLICQARGRRSTHWAFDSFEGISNPSPSESEFWTAGDLAVGEEAARSLLEPLGAVVLRGWIPEVFAQASIERLVFAHVDVDIHDPTLASFEYFYDLLVPGGLLVCDDYGFSMCEGARQAVDEFMAPRPENVIHSPTGQGIVIKQ